MTQIGDICLKSVIFEKMCIILKNRVKPLFDTKMAENRVYMPENDDFRAYMAYITPSWQEKLQHLKMKMEKWEFVEKMRIDDKSM